MLSQIMNFCLKMHFLRLKKNKSPHTHSYCLKDSLRNCLYFNVFSNATLERIHWFCCLYFVRLNGYIFHDEPHFYLLCGLSVCWFICCFRLILNAFFEVEHNIISFTNCYSNLHILFSRADAAYVTYHQNH